MNPIGHGQEMKPGHPEKLLWLVSGKLRPEEAREIEAHLRGCAECQGIAKTLASWKTGVIRRAEPARHPAPEALDSIATRTPPESPAAQALLEEHLHGCAACREDVAELRRLYEATSGRNQVDRPAAVRKWVLAASLAGVLAAPLIWFLLAGRGSEPVLMPSLRSSTPGLVLAGTGPWRAILVPPSAAPPGLYEMRIERRDGSLVERMDPRELLAGQERMRIEIPALHGPESYRVVLAPGGSGGPAVQFYPFRVEPGPGD